MNKVLAQGAKYIFGVFALAVLGLLISLTYQALGRIFPNRFDNQVWGLILFDIAAAIWAITFIFHSKSTTQYAVAGIGFITGLLGTLGMIAAEVTLGSNLSNADTSKIGQWLLWAFIGATALHAVLIYVHHFGAPAIHEQIELGVARGSITTEAIKQATAGLAKEQSALAETLAREITDRVKRDLNLPILADPRMPIIPHPTTYEQTVPLPIMGEIDWKEINSGLESIKQDLLRAKSNLAEQMKITDAIIKQSEPKPSFFRSDPSYYPKPTPQDEAAKPESPFRGSPSK